MKDIITTNEILMYFGITYEQMEAILSKICPSFVE